MRVWLGIDVGLSGAAACINENGELVVHDTPTLEVGKGRRGYDVGAMADILEDLVSYGDSAQRVCALELVHSMPKEGVRSAFSFGCGFGIWQGLLVGLRIPYELVTPQAWKKLLLNGQPKEKGASILKAKQLFPNAPLTLKKHHNRADAILLAEFCRRTTRGG